MTGFKKALALIAFAMIAVGSLTSCSWYNRYRYGVHTPVGCATEVEGTVAQADCQQCVLRAETYNSYYNYCMD